MLISWFFLGMNDLAEIFLVNIYKVHLYNKKFKFYTIIIGGIVFIFYM